MRGILFTKFLEVVNLILEQWKLESKVVYSGIRTYKYEIGSSESLPFQLFERSNRKVLFIIIEN